MPECILLIWESFVALITVWHLLEMHLNITWNFSDVACGVNTKTKYPYCTVSVVEEGLKHL